MNNEVDVIPVTGTFDYRNSVSGSYKLYDILYNKNFHMDYDYIMNFNMENIVVEKYISLFNKMGIWLEKQH